MIAESALFAPAANPEATFHLFVRGTDMAGESFDEEAAVSDDLNFEEFYMILHHQVESGQELDISIRFTYEDGSPRVIRETVAVSRTEKLGAGAWGVAFRVAH